MSSRKTRTGSAGGRPRRGLASARGFVSAAVLVVVGIFVGWLSFRSMIIRILPPTAHLIARIAPTDPDRVLARTSVQLVTQHGILAPATLDMVRRAAIAAPLDARPYLILGHQHLLERRSDRAVATLEVGQRLDPRQRLIHILLLDRYLREARYAKAASQFSVLARLLSETRAPIANALAQMTMAPQTRDAVRRTLHADPTLERAVLIALARSDTAPGAIFTLASPAAQADAGNKESWGPVLVASLVSRGHYLVARAVWQRIYSVSSAQTTALITNADFRRTTARPPFDWALAAGSLGAADLRNGSLAVDYYGRDSGDLASQLLVLKPGHYHFSFVVDAGKTNAASKLFWSLSCGSVASTADKALLMNVAVIGADRARRIGANFTVPSACPAQMLTLRGEAGDFPAPLGITLREPDIRLAVETRSETAS